MSVFGNCSKLSSIKLPNDLIEIGSNVFYNCTSLTNITIPSKVTNIGSSVFQSGSYNNKTTIIFEGTTPPSISTSTFNKNFLNRILVPKGYAETYKTATNWAYVASYIYEIETGA